MALASYVCRASARHEGQEHLKSQRLYLSFGNLCTTTSTERVRRHTLHGNKKLKLCRTMTPYQNSQVNALYVPTPLMPSQSPPSGSWPVQQAAAEVAVPARRVRRHRLLLLQGRQRQQQRRAPPQPQGVAFERKTRRGNRRGNGPRVVSCIAAYIHPYGMIS